MHNIVLEQSGEKLTGTHEAEFDHGDLNGTASWDMGAFEYDPARETESMAVAAKSPDTHSIVNDGTYSHGQGTWLHANAVNDFVTYSVPVLAPGTYSILVRGQRANDRGRVQVATASTQTGTYTNLGGTQDFYSASTNFVSTTLGTVTFSSSGTKFFRFTVVGKNGSSSGFHVRLDNVALTLQ